jgi:hypothetical protein
MVGVVLLAVFHSSSRDVVAYFDEVDEEDSC